MDFGLSDEQLEFQALCRRFATEHIRPVAAKHDAEESTPWEVLKAAREQGLTGSSTSSGWARDPDGQLGVIDAEEFHWGCAGIALAISGSRLAAAGLASVGDAGADRPLGAGVLRRRRRDQARRLRGDRAAGRLGRQEPAHDRQARRRRVGPERHQGLHHQRWHRRRPRRRRQHVRPEPRPPRPGLVRDREGHARPQARARRSRSSASAPRTRPRSILEDCRIPLENLLGGMEKLERKLDRARRGESAARGSNALATFELTRPIVGASALGIAQAAYEWTLAYLDDRNLPVDPCSSSRSTRARPPASRRSSASATQQTARPRRDRDRGGAAAGPARLVDGPQRHPADGRAGLDVEAEGRRRRGVGDPHDDRPGRALSRRRRTARSRSGSATRRSTSCSRARPRSSAWSISRMQAAEYRERLREAPPIAAEAMQNGAAGNGSTPAAAGNGAAPSDERATTVS